MRKNKSRISMKKSGRVGQNRQPLSAFCAAQKDELCKSLPAANLYPMLRRPFFCLVAIALAAITRLCRASAGDARLFLLPAEANK